MEGRIIWPAYLDANKSRSEGRKIPLRDAVRSPNVNEIAEAARSLGISADVEIEKSYPRSHWEHSGRVVIFTDENKLNLLRKIASEIKRKRSEKTAEQRETDAKKAQKKQKKKKKQRKGRKEKKGKRE